MISVYILLTIMIVLWAFSFIVVDVSITFLTPLSVAFYRFLFASLSYMIIDIIIRVKKKRSNSKEDSKQKSTPFNWKDWLILFLATQFGVVLFFYTQYNAIQSIGPSLPALFVCLLSPILIAVFALAFFNEKLNSLKVIGFLIATIGGFFLVTGGDINTLNPTTPNFLGLIFALFTPLFWALYTILTKILMKNHSTNTLLKDIAYLGTLELFLIILFNGDISNFLNNALNWVVLISALYLGPVCYTLGYYIWQDSQRNLNSSNVASFLYVEPFITLVLSYLFQIKETVLIGNILGGFVVLIAVVIINYNFKKKI